MRHCNINNMNNSGKKLESNIAPYGLKIFGHKDQFSAIRIKLIRISPIVTETNGNELCFDTFDLTDHFVSLVETKIERGKRTTKN